MRLFEITKTLKDLVWAPDDQGAFNIFNAHMPEVHCDDSRVQEIKGVDRLKALGYDDHLVWGAPDDSSASELLKSAEDELWDGRRAVRVIAPDDTGENLRDLVPGYDKDVDVGRDVIGHVVYLLPDGGHRLESGDQRRRRLESGRSDREMALEIELAAIKARLKEVVK